MEILEVLESSTGTLVDLRGLAPNERALAIMHDKDDLVGDGDEDDD